MNSNGHTFTITSAGCGGSVNETSGTISYTTGQSVLAGTFYNLIINGTGSIPLCGNVTVNGTLTLTSGALSIGANTLTLANGSSLVYGSGTITGGASSNLTIGTGTAINPLNTITGGLLSFNISRNVTLGANLAIAGNLTLTGTTLDLSTFTANRGVAGGTLSLDATSSLLIGGTNTFPTNYTTNTLTAGSIINYYGTNQIVAVQTYSYLTLSGSGTKTFTATSTVNRILSMQGTAVFAGTVPNIGAASTLQYMGSSAQTTGNEFRTPWTGTGGLDIENANGVALGAARSVGANPVTIGGTVASSVLNDGGFTLTCTGTLNLNSGTFNLGSALTATAFPGFTTRNYSAGTTVGFVSGVAQAVAATTYPNLTFSGAGLKTTAG